jgi:hypothetical protein
MPLSSSGGFYFTSYPLGFVKIRHFGFLSSRRRSAALALCRERFTPTSASWHNQIEIVFCLLQRKTLNGGLQKQKRTGECYRRVH